jgi:hypothetical protein
MKLMDYGLRKGVLWSMFDLGNKHDSASHQAWPCYFVALKTTLKSDAPHRGAG